jgi:hypothetical protein
METEKILDIIKELTLDFVNGKRNRDNTVQELRRRINPTDIYRMPETVAYRTLITEVYVSLDNLIEEGFAPSVAEIKYLAECLEGKRGFSQAEVREFPIGAFEKEHPKIKRARSS